MTEQKNIFRKKSLDRISEPEQLNQYLKVSTLPVWLLLITIIIFLGGVCIWGIFGTLESRVSAVAVIHEGVATCYVPTTATNLVPEMTVESGKTQGRILSVDSKPIQLDSNFDSYALFLGNFKAGDWVVPVKVELALPDGAYEVSIITESIHPVSFLVN